MRLKDITEAKKQQPIKARDPNWRDMEALRKSGAAGSHGDKTKTIPRKEKYKKISMEDQFQQYMEADPDTLGKMNDKMRDVLSKVDTDDKAQAQAAKDAEQKAKADQLARAEKLKKENPQMLEKYISMLKSHDWTYEYSDDHRMWQRGSDEAGKIRLMAKDIDPDLKLYKQYSPFHKDDEPEQESIQTNYKVSDIFKALEQVEETATSGATSSGNIATVVSPHIAIGDKKTRKKYGLTGGLPNPPKAKAQKPTDNALNMKGTSIFGGPLKR